MPSMTVRGGTRVASISAVVRHADGRVEDLGRICFWHRNPLKRWAWQLGHFLKSLRRR